MKRLILIIPVLFLLSCQMAEMSGENGAEVNVSQYPAPDENIEYTLYPILGNAYPPEYPRLAKAAGLEATAWVRALIDTTGKVVEAKIHKSSGNKAGFDEAAVMAAYHCQFEPAYCGRVTCAAWVTMRAEFRLENREAISRLVLEE